MMHRFDNLPEDHRQELIRLKPWIDSLPRGLPRGDDRTRYLFEIYNEYFGGSTIMEESCNSCLGKVLRKTNEAIEYYGY
jgi:hypothetical protein